MNARKKESGILVSEEEELPIGRGWFVSISLVMLNAKKEKKKTSFHASQSKKEEEGRRFPKKKNSIKTVFLKKSFSWNFMGNPLF